MGNLSCRSNRNNIYKAWNFIPSLSSFCLGNNHAPHITTPNCNEPVKNNREFLNETSIRRRKQDKRFDFGIGVTRCVVWEPSTEENWTERKLKLKHTIIQQQKTQNTAVAVASFLSSFCYNNFDATCVFSINECWKVTKTEGHRLLLLLFFHSFRFFTLLTTF